MLCSVEKQGHLATKTNHINNHRLLLDPEALYPR